MSGFFAVCMCVAAVLLWIASAGGRRTMQSAPLTTLPSTGRVPPVVTKAGKDAFEVVLRKGQIHSEGSNAQATFQPPGFFPAEEVRWRFKIWFDDAFPWAAKNGQRVGGKLGGFAMGQGKASGGYYSDKAATLRLIFDDDRGALAYLYPQVRRTFTSDATWDLLDQTDELEAASYIATGVHVFAPNKKPQLRFKSGQWNEVELYAKLNTPGKYNGVIELVVNGQSAKVSSVRFRYTSDVKINHVTLAPFFGGSTTAFAPPTDIRIWYSDFEFSRI